MHMSAASIRPSRCFTSCRSEKRLVSPRWYTTLPPRPITSPAGVFTVPFGVVEVCHAGVRRTQRPASSNVTVPPMFGSATFSTPSSPSSPASSTIATTCAFVRLALSPPSPRWSAWAWLRKMCVGSSSAALTAAFGLPLRNGSISTRVSPSLSSKQAWPRKRMSIWVLPASIVVVEFARQLPADGDAHQHPDPRLLGEERADGGDAVLGFGSGRVLEQLALLRLPEPAALVEGLGEDSL